MSKPVSHSRVSCISHRLSNPHIYSLSLERLGFQNKTKIETGIFYGNLRRKVLLKVMASVLGAFVHHEVRWSDRIVVIDHKLIVVQASSSFRENLTPGQYPRYETAKKNTHRIVPRGRSG